MIKIAVCDDSESTLRIIKNLILSHKCRYTFQVSCYASGNKLIEDTDKGAAFDILFLDIEMDGLSGLDCAGKIKKKNPNSIIIFITNYTQYISETFRLGAFQYLLKPVNEDDFNYDFDRAIAAYMALHEKFTVTWKGKTEIIATGQIHVVESINRHIKIYSNETVYECTGKLTDIYQKLRPFGFTRSHQSFLVNMSHISSVNYDKLQLDNGMIIPVGRVFREEMLKDFNQYLSGVKV